MGNLGVFEFHIGTSDGIYKHVPLQSAAMKRTLRFNTMRAKEKNDRNADVDGRVTGEVPFLPGHAPKSGRRDTHTTQEGVTTHAFPRSNGGYASPLSTPFSA